MGIKMALKRGWKSVGRRQKRRCWLGLAPPFLGLLEDAEKGRFCRDFGFGNSFGNSVWELIFESLGIQKVEMRGWRERG
mgnify:FL=1